LEAFEASLREDGHPPHVADALELLCELFGLWCVFRDRGFFLEDGYIAANKSVAIRRRLDQCCDALAPKLGALVDGFGIPEIAEGNPNVPPIVRGLASYSAAGPEWRCRI
jgi:acyl-CoA oxidase